MSERQLKLAVSVLYNEAILSALYALVPIDLGFGELNT